MHSDRRELVVSAGWLSLAALAGCASRRVDRPGAALPRPSPISDQQASEAAFLALGLVGTPYRYGGNTPEAGFDCSGLIGYVYQRSAGISPPRTVAQISRWGESIMASAVRAGDLVIFGSNGTPSHAAIHAGESRFVHAPSTGGTRSRLRAACIRYGNRSERPALAKTLRVAVPAGRAMTQARR